MKPDIVVDVGNTRIKWGLCSSGRVEEMVSLEAFNTQQWEDQVRKWFPHGQPRWFVACVNFLHHDAFKEWVRIRRDDITIPNSNSQIPIRSEVDKPELVGMDRLLNGVAALHRRKSANPCVIVDAGSAVTVDFIDSAGTFRGGAIMPGLGLMAHSLRDRTYSLPLITVKDEFPSVPARSTATAIEAGIFWSAVGGIHALCRQMAQGCPSGQGIDFFLTGGDGSLLKRALTTFPLPQLGEWRSWPEMTLEGLRLTAEALP
jgi:type III pantothenate kinase